MNTVKEKTKARKLLEGEPVLVWGYTKISLDELLTRLRNQILSAEAGNWSVSLGALQEFSLLALECFNSLQAVKFSDVHEAEYASESAVLQDSLQKLIQILVMHHETCFYDCGEGTSLCSNHLKSLSEYCAPLDFCGR